MSRREKQAAKDEKKAKKQAKKEAKAAAKAEKIAVKAAAKAKKEAAKASKSSSAQTNWDSTEESQWQPETPSSISKSVISCQECGAVNNSDTAYCSSCGAFL